MKEQNPKEPLSFQLVKHSSQELKAWMFALELSYKRVQSIIKAAEGKNTHG